MGALLGARGRKVGFTYGVIIGGQELKSGVQSWGIIWGQGPKGEIHSWGNYWGPGAEKRSLMGIIAGQDPFMGTSLGTNDQKVGSIRGGVK